MAERIEVLVISHAIAEGWFPHELRSPLARLSVALGWRGSGATPEVEGSLNRINWKRPVESA